MKEENVKSLHLALIHFGGENLVIRSLDSYHLSQSLFNQYLKARPYCFKRENAAQ